MRGHEPNADRWLLPDGGAKADIRDEASDQSHSPAQAIWEIGLTLATALGLAVVPNLAFALGVL